VVNADEGEPGTCKDRPLMEMDPHQLIEGMVIAGRAIGSHQGFIYIRGEYRYLLEIMQKAIDDAYARGFLGKNIFGSGYDFRKNAATGSIRLPGICVENLQVGVDEASITVLRHPFGTSGVPSAVR